MSKPIRLPRISGINPEVDATIDEILRMIERGLNITVEAPLEFANGQSGPSMRVNLPRGVTSAVAASGGITAAPDANTLGRGNIIIRNRNGAALSDGETGSCYSNFTVAIPEGTRLEVEYDGSAYKLIGADCPQGGS